MYARFSKYRCASCRTTIFEICRVKGFCEYHRDLEKMEEIFYGYKLLWSYRFCH